MTLERIQIRLPDGFDPSRHTKALPAAVAKRHGDGWEVESITPGTGLATLVRHTTVMEVTEVGDGKTGPRAFEIRLPAGTKTTDADRVATRQADLNPGYHLIRFEPHLLRAVLARMSEPELRCREAVANALGCKPWDVTCRQRPDGGFTLQLPGSYTPSKHDTKLLEVAESIVGRFGWYTQVDPMTRQCEIIPADPPTFPALIKLDLNRLGKGDLMRTPFGIKLPKPGEKGHTEAYVDWKAQAWGLLGGMPGAGKSVTLFGIVSHHLANGGELVIIDDPEKSADFDDFKPFVRDGGWGCTGLRSAVTALALVDEEGNRRAEWMRERGYKNWLDVPEKDRFKPILIIVDEVEMLLVTDRIPAGVDKSDPEVQALLEENRLRFKLQRLISQVVAKHRFTGCRMILSNQVTNTNTGLPPTLKAKLGHRWLQGPNPSKTQRDQAFNLASKVPEVPGNVQASGAAVLGVGTAELSGQEPFVYKTFFTDTKQVIPVLTKLGVRRTIRPDPTEAEMDRLCPVGGVDDDDVAEPVRVGGERLPSGKPLSSLPPEFGPLTAYGDDGKPLKGAAAAARAGKQLHQKAEKQGSAEPDGPPCPSCDQPIRADGACGCSW